MAKILASRRFHIGFWVFVVLAWLFYLMVATSVGVDREAYNRGEEVYTIGFSYFGKKTFGGGASTLPETLTFRTEDGKVLPPYEMVKFINPELNPFVKDGRVYISTPEFSEWGKRVYWAPVNPVTTNVAKALRFMHGQ